VAAREYPLLLAGRGDDVGSPQRRLEAVRFRVRVQTL